MRRNSGDERGSQRRSVQSVTAVARTSLTRIGIAEKTGALEVPLHLRIDRELDTALRRRAAEAQIPTSALVRRLLREAIQGQRRESPTVGEIEEIARRVAREEIAGR